MGLYKQPNQWTCGPFALKHALVALGRLADERRIAWLARTHWWSGTDEIRLARAARAYDCELKMVRRTDAAKARRELERYLDRNIPVLLCVDGWEHWIAAVRRQGRRFVVVDSRTEPVLNVYSWPQLRARWRYVDEERDGRPATLYDLHPVKPRFRVMVRADFSVERARFLRRPENRDLALHWDEYLGDLLEICRPRTTRTDVVTLGEFLRRQRDVLVPRIVHWHGAVSNAEVRRLLRNFRFVAETYGLVIPASAMRRPLADFAILGALWAASTRAVGSLYGSAGALRHLRRRAG